MDDLPLTEEPVEPRDAVGASGDAVGAQMTLFAVIVSAFLFVRKFAGLIKEILLANFFHATAATDAFKIVYNSIIYNLYSDAEQLLRPTYLPEWRTSSAGRTRTRSYRRTSRR